MKHLTILVPDTQTTLSTISCIVGSYDIFSRANKYWMENGKRQLFKIKVAGVSEQSEISNGLITIRPQINVAEFSKPILLSFLP